MTFKEVSIKNFKANLRKYMAYFLCSSFSVMMFFMISTVAFNTNIEQGIIDGAIYMMLHISMVVLFIFAVFFISYAHISFVRSRSCEFGLYMTLGMNNRDIVRMIIVENSLVGTLSVFSGIICGTVFSRLFFMVLLGLMEVSGIKFYLPVKSFLLTSGVFFAVFAIVISISSIIVFRMEISELLNQNRKAMKNKVTHPILGFAGLIIIVFSILRIKFHIQANNPDSVLLMMAGCLIGLYIFISQVGSLLLSVYQKNKRRLYRDILSISGISDKFAQNKKVIFIICILSAVTVFYIGMMYSVYASTLWTAENERINHIAYSEVMGRNSIEEEQLLSIIHGGETDLVQREDIEFIRLKFLISSKASPEQRPQTVAVLSESSFSGLSGKKPGLSRKEVSFLDQSIEGTDRSSIQDKISLFSSGKNYDFLKADTIKERILSMPLYGASTLYIMNDEDYMEIRETLGKDDIGIYHIFNFKDWRKTLRIDKELDSALMLANKKPGVPPVSGSSYEVMGLSTAISRVELYVKNRQQNSLAMFISSFIGLLCFVSCGSVLYFKLYTEIGEEKKRYCKLFKIGITSQEMKRVISRELSILFFIPTIAGSIVGYSVIFQIADTNISPIKVQLLCNSLFIVAVYFILQTAFYFVTRNKYINEVLEL